MLTVVAQNGTVFEAAGVTIIPLLGHVASLNLPRALA